MRRRIVLSTTALVALVLVVFAVPLAMAVRGLEVSRALDTVQAETEGAAILLEEQVNTLGEAQVLLGLLAQHSGMRFTLFQGTSVALVDTGAGPVPAPEGPAVLAARGQSARAHTGDALVAAEPVFSSVGRSGLVLRAIRPDGGLDAAVNRSLLLIGLGALGVLGAAVAGAWFQARRLSRPFERLADAARRLGQGDFTARAQRSGLDEADAIADALDVTAERLGRALERGTAFASDTSHQLRTPLTALRLQLESLQAVPGHAPAVDEALAEADRLQQTIDELVALTRPETAEQLVSVRQLIRDRLPAWRAQLATAGRELVADLPEAPPVRVRPGAVGQALQVLIDNAANHGRGTVTVEVRRTTGGQATRIRVRDEGPGLPDDVEIGRPGADRGEVAREGAGGHGLLLARALVEAEGGSLVADEGSPCIVLPAAHGTRAADGRS